MARGDVILRQWNLLKMLQTRGEGVPLRSMAEAFNVTERTIQRDLVILEELGFPLEHEADDGGKRFWRLPHNFLATAPLVLSLTEAVSLHLADRMMDPLSGTLFAQGFEDTLRKIRASIPQPALDYFAEVDGMLFVRRFGRTDYSAHSEVIRALIDAARDQTCVRIDYQSLWKGRRYETVFEPYGMVFFEGDLYTVGRSHRADDLRNFKVTRIASLSHTGDRFHRPEEFSLERHFQTTFGIVQTGSEPMEVVARFRGAAAALVEERIWHESQQLAWLDPEATLFDEDPGTPENLVATFRLGNLVEFKRWVRGFGQDAEVLKPESLRGELREEFLATARLYE